MYCPPTIDWSSAMSSAARSGNPWFSSRIIVFPTRTAPLLTTSVSVTTPPIAPRSISAIPCPYERQALRKNASTPTASSSLASSRPSVQSNPSSSMWPM